jgi:opacity protein-like surface antigen
MQFALDWADVDYRANLVRQNGSSVSANGTMESFTPRMNVQFNVLDRPLTPFLMAGVGYSYIDTNIPNGRPQTGCWYDPWYGYICQTYQSTKTTDELTYQFGVGGRWDFSSTGSVRVAYERHYIDFSNTSSAPYVDQVKLGFVFRY